MSSIHSIIAKKISDNKFYKRRRVQKAHNEMLEYKQAVKKAQIEKEQEISDINKKRLKEINNENTLVQNERNKQSDENNIRKELAALLNVI